MKFRKKPVEIEARQFNGRSDNADDAGLVEWIGGDSYRESTHGIGGERRYAIYIPTLEGRMRADPGDWIIKGVEGEFYPCKPDIFEKTYDKVEQ